MVQLRYCLGLVIVRCMPLQKMYLVGKPTDQEWGTCISICILCHKPQLKLERLIALKLIAFVDLESISNDQFDYLL